MQKVPQWISRGLAMIRKSAMIHGVREATQVAGTYPHPPENIRIEQTIQPGDVILGFDLPVDETLNFFRKVKTFRAFAIQKNSHAAPNIPVGIQTDPTSRKITVQTNDLGQDTWLVRIRAENEHGYVESRDFEFSWSE